MDGVSKIIDRDEWLPKFPMVMFLAWRWNNYTASKSAVFQINRLDTRFEGCRLCSAANDRCVLIKFMLREGASPGTLSFSISLCPHGIVRALGSSSDFFEYITWKLIFLSRWSVFLWNTGKFIIACPWLFSYPTLIFYCLKIIFHPLQQQNFGSAFISCELE